jgi:hypothetical protein
MRLPGPQLLAAQQFLRYIRIKIIGDKVCELAEKLQHLALSPAFISRICYF